MIKNQKGVALSEFIIAGPLVMFIGLAAIQYGLIYNARMNVTYAAYEAVRAGAVNNADPVKIQNAFYKGLVPYYSSTGVHLPGGIHLASPFKKGLKSSNDLQLATGGYVLKEMIKKSESAFVGIHMVNPSKASFDDWNDPVLNKVYRIKTGMSRRIIPNRDIDTRDKGKIGKKSKQTLQDANVLKLRITYGYEPRVPLMKGVFSAVTAFFGSQRDAVSARILAAGRIPIVVDITSQMLSPPIEGGLPGTTVNRTGFILNQQLADKIVENETMQWQVGRQDEDIKDIVVDDAKTDLGNAVKGAIGEQGVTGASLGNAVKDSVLGSVTGVIATDGQTGKAGKDTHQILGDMNGLVSCSNGQSAPNFY